MLLTPAEPILDLAVFKFATSVQALPFHDSVRSSGLLPVGGLGSSIPKAKADVAVPVPPLSTPPLFISPTSVQVDPSYNSVFPATPGIGAPPKVKAEVLSAPAPEFCALAVFKSPPVAQAPVELTAAPLNFESVVLYQTCPSTGLDGLSDLISIWNPCMSL